MKSIMAIIDIMFSNKFAKLIIYFRLIENTLQGPIFLLTIRCTAISGRLNILFILLLETICGLRLKQTTVHKVPELFLGETNRGWKHLGININNFQFFIKRGYIPPPPLFHPPIYVHVYYLLL